MEISKTLRRSLWVLVAILIISLLEAATGLAALSIVALFMSGLLFMLLYWIAISYIALRSEKESDHIVKEHKIIEKEHIIISVEEVPSLEQAGEF